MFFLRDVDFVFMGTLKFVLAALVLVLFGEID
jgi:hypothetical protein